MYLTPVKIKLKLFLDCGSSPNITNSVKSVGKVVNVNSDTTVEQVVSYTCKDQYFKVPESADTTHTCVNGSWVNNEKFECLKSKISNKIRFATKLLLLSTYKSIYFFNFFLTLSK